MNKKIIIIPIITLILAISTQAIIIDQFTDGAVGSSIGDALWWRGTQFYSNNTYENITIKHRFRDLSGGGCDVNVKIYNHNGSDISNLTELADFGIVRVTTTNVWYNWTNPSFQLQNNTYYWIVTGTRGSQICGENGTLAKLWLLEDGSATGYAYMRSTNNLTSFETYTPNWSHDFIVMNGIVTISTTPPTETFTYDSEDLLPATGNVIVKATIGLGTLAKLFGLLTAFIIGLLIYTGITKKS